MYRLGIDIDKVKTTGVVMNQHGTILSLAKEQTSIDILTGISVILQKLLKPMEGLNKEISEVIIGTDYFSNALMEGKKLTKVCSIRIGQDKCTIPPLYGCSDNLRHELGLAHYHIFGRQEMDGSNSLLKTSKQELEKHLVSIRKQGFDSFAITGTFSPVNSTQEELVAEWIQEILGDHCFITTSHELGNIGFLERENSAILNSALFNVSNLFLKELKELIKQNQIYAKLYFTQSDGSLLSYDYVQRQPVRTIGSRISSSFHGASLLTKLNDCVIVDVSHSGTTIGLLEKGFPKENRRNRKIAGVRVNLPIPDTIVLSLENNDPVNDVQIDALYNAIQRFQPHFEPLPIIFVGEESELVASTYKHPWVDVLHPHHFQNASVVGACLAPVSGTVDCFYWLKELSREETIQMAKAEAIQMAINAGAAPETVSIQTVETIPLSYMPTKALRIKVKAIGNLSNNYRSI